LVEGNLVETQDDRSVLLNQQGVLLSVQTIDPTTLTVTLNGTPAPAPVVGSDETLHPLLRRWDQTSGDPNPAAGGLTLDPADNCAFVQEGSWLTLEDGVQIFFQRAGPVLPVPSTANQYLTGDYWLIPARTATGDVEWPTTTDEQGDIIPVALPPHGITHYYAPLAVVSLGTGGIETPVQDCRCGFSGPCSQNTQTSRSTKKG
jgi:hypothetical protein